MADRPLEKRFRELRGFSDRHSRREREQCAAAIALGRKEREQYERIQAHIQSNHR
jgi:hypothetical protein